MDYRSFGQVVLSLYQSMYAKIDVGMPSTDALCGYVYDSIASSRPFINIDFTELQ